MKKTSSERKNIFSNEFSLNRKNPWGCQQQRETSNKHSKFDEETTYVGRGDKIAKFKRQIGRYLNRLLKAVMVQHCTVENKYFIYTKM